MHKRKNLFIIYFLIQLSISCSNFEGIDKKSKISNINYINDIIKNLDSLNINLSPELKKTVDINNIIQKCKENGLDRELTIYKENIDVIKYKYEKYYFHNIYVSKINNNYCILFRYEKINDIWKLYYIEFGSKDFNKSDIIDTE